MRDGFVVFCALEALANPGKSVEQAKMVVFSSFLLNTENPAKE